MSDVEMWGLVVGFFLPPLIAIIQQPTWSRTTRGIVTVLVCLVVGAATTWIHGDWSGRTATTTILLTLVATMTAYRNFWVHRVAPVIEAATSPHDPPVVLAPEDRGRDRLNPGS